MNKLVIIGNGFDLAHGLKTSYKDFLLWEINEAFRSCKDHKIIKSPLFTIESKDHIYNYENTTEPYIFKSIDEFKAFLRENVVEKKLMKDDYTYQFIKDLFGIVNNNNWVDIEREYYKKLLFVNQLRSSNNDIWRKRLTELNSALELLKNELEKYLKDVKYNGYLQDVMSCFNNEIDINRLNSFEKVLFLNFNYTSTIENYLHNIDMKFVSVNYIHGKLEDKNNPIIFGYGDEIDDRYAEIEKLNNNNFLMHMKSFAYLQTSNYKKLFEFLDQDSQPFDVYIMGHSCGLSDRLLFTHIFEHENFNTVKIYYHQKSDTENDFFEKTQNLSRYFRLDYKHRMRTKVVPFNESIPLTKFNPQN